MYQTHTIFVNIVYYIRYLYCHQSDVTVSFESLTNMRVDLRLLYIQSLYIFLQQSNIYNILCKLLIHIVLYTD